MSRPAIPAAIKREVKKRGACERCADDVGPFHIDHIDPRWISGRDDIENLQLLCISCHRDKTKGDAKIIAKVKRMGRKHSGKTRTRRSRKIQSRPFDKRWKRRINKPTELRAQQRKDDD